jgi:2-polyprenyl-6-methoxyphenol hydroxylase-like FAD-dependent oxidoreductase
MAADQPTAAVVGGGIAGLASAVALAQAGWQVTVLERAPAFGDVGAGLAITGNGMTALAALGLEHKVRAAGYQTCAAGYQDVHGNWLLRLPDTSQDAGAVTTMWGLHRQRLHAVLSEAAQATDGIELVADAEVSAVQPGIPGGEKAALTIGTGASARAVSADLVVGADGVRSAVRTELFPAVRPVYSGSTSWRGVVADSDSDGRLTQAYGPHTDFGTLRISDAEMYWYGYFRNPEGAVFPDEAAAARSHFANWAPWIREMVAATPAGRLMRHDVYHLPKGPRAYVSGRVVLAGDAAHAMQPTAGQGAATALEDGVCVGRMIGAAVLAGGDMESALTSYDRARRPRCQRMVRTGITIARMGADLGGGWPQTVRNTALRLAPVRLLTRTGGGIVRWTAPDVPAAGSHH